MSFQISFQPGRDIGGPQFKPGPRKGLARSQRKADQDSSLAKGQVQAVLEEQKLNKE